LYQADCYWAGRGDIFKVLTRGREIVVQIADSCEDCDYPGGTSPWKDLKTFALAPGQVGRAVR
jgi:hypothetical protein